MLPNKRGILIVLFTSFLFLAACGTFEIGIENNVNPENEVEITEQPTSEIENIVTPVATRTPIPTDEQLIAAAIADNIGQPLDQLEITVTTIIGPHATGIVDNGYFLAAK